MRKIALLTVVLAIAGTVAACGNGYPVQTITSQQFAIQSLMNFQGPEMCEDVHDYVVDSVGLGQYDGSYQDPGSLGYTVNSNTGAVTVRWTLTADPEGVGWLYSHGKHTFVFRVSQNGETVWPINNNATQIIDAGSSGCV